MVCKNFMHKSVKNYHCLIRVIENLYLSAHEYKTCSEMIANNLLAEYFRIPSLT